MQIEVSEQDGRTLLSMAAIRGCPPGEVVTWLLAQIPGSPHNQDAEIEVFATYHGSRVSAVFRRDTRAVKITSGVLSGETFKSPSSAASHVVTALNPGRKKAATNGLVFWRTADGRDLKAILG
jgi:hypothetical protein